MNTADKITALFFIATFIYLSVYLVVSLFWVFKNNNKENNNISNASKKNKGEQNAQQKRNEST